MPRCKQCKQVVRKEDFSVLFKKCMDCCRIDPSDCPPPVGEDSFSGGHIPPPIDVSKVTDAVTGFAERIAKGTGHEIGDLLIAAGTAINTLKELKARRRSEGEKR
jgi:hypothetical protein